MEEEEVLRPSDPSTDFVAHIRDGIEATRRVTGSPTWTHALAFTAPAFLARDYDLTSRSPVMRRAIPTSAGWACIP